MLKKFLIMLKKCTYNSQHTAHYAQVEPIIRLIQSDILYEMGENYLLYCNITDVSSKDRVCLSVKLFESIEKTLSAAADDG